MITCGLKEKDTVIFSSINLDEGNVVLELQRNVKNIENKILEPFEKRIDISEDVRKTVFSTEELILAVTALMFCEKI